MTELSAPRKKLNAKEPWRNPVGLEAVAGFGGSPFGSLRPKTRFGPLE